MTNPMDGFDPEQADETQVFSSADESTRYVDPQATRVAPAAEPVDSRTYRATSAHTTHQATIRRKPLASPPQQAPYVRDPFERLDQVDEASVHTRSNKLIKKIALIAIGILVALIVVTQVITCSMQGIHRAQNAGSNAVTATPSEKSKEKSPSANGSSKKSSPSTGDTGQSVGSSVGGAVGDFIDDVGNKLSSLDTSGITDQLSRAGKSLGNAAGDLADAAGNLIGQLVQ